MASQYLDNIRNDSLNQAQEEANSALIEALENVAEAFDLDPDDFKNEVAPLIEQKLIEALS